MMKSFADLSEKEVLALAISNEEEDCRIYLNIADRLHEQYPSSAKLFQEMAAEETGHRDMLYDLYRKKFGELLPLIRRQDVRGFIKHQPFWTGAPREACSAVVSLPGGGGAGWRGRVTGMMTFQGGIGHTRPYLIPSFLIAPTASFAGVAIELAVISYVRYRYMDTPLLQAAFQV